MTDQYSDLAAIRERLKGTHGKEFWRSLEELVDAEGFEKLVHAEFPRQAAAWVEGMSRRHFLKLMGASLALAGLSGCSNIPRRKLVPYVKQPEQLVLGVPLYFATAMSVSGVALGLLVEQHEGRPIKIEGNPSHPGARGATDVFTQASVLGLYDPDRSQATTKSGQISTWPNFIAEVRSALDGERGSQGGGVRILTEMITAPALVDLVQGLLRDLPGAKWVQFEPAGPENAVAGARMAFGDNAQPVYDFTKADRILSLDSDILGCTPGNLRYVQDFASRRRVAEAQGAPAQNRLYAVESWLSHTGAAADHRLPMRGADVETFARALASRLGAQGGGGQAPQSVPPGWMDALVADLQAHKGKSLVVAGDGQPPVVHALAHAMNDALGNVGQTVSYFDPLYADAKDRGQTMRDLVNDMNAGTVKVLAIVGGNPAYTAPADLNFADALKKVPFSVHLSLYNDETSALTTWHIAESHFLEAWGDARGHDGTASIVQPLIAPLYDTRSAWELLAAMSSGGERTGLDVVQAYWKGQKTGGDFNTLWQKTLSDGVLPDTGLKPKSVTLRGAGDWGAPTSQPPAPGPQSLEIVFRADPHIHDGRFANNGWLQELPKPFSKITWDNAAYVSPATADRLGLSLKPGEDASGLGQDFHTEMVELSYQGRKVTAPIFVQPGTPDDTVTVFLGYGRTKAGATGNGVGFNAYALRTSDPAWFGGGLQLTKTGQGYLLASTQPHHLMHGRKIVRAATLEEYGKNPKFATEGESEAEVPGTLFPPFEYKDNKWGMVIDLSTCVGCQACVVACYSENNIALVGKEGVARSREMAWLRIDSYYTGNLEKPATYFQPVPCMQCEAAPCELVCPVAATTHSAEGLNDMVYNRCVGTRYCSNNCPYKVRRFNFFAYTNYPLGSPIRLRQNPDVTVRNRGVMEKCTYCVQRIREAEIAAQREGRKLGGDEVLTACQAACPTQAIVFGDLNDPNSRVAKLRKTNLNYNLLGELNTQPRTTYLAAVRNPNPDIKEE